MSKRTYTPRTTVEQIAIGGSNQQLSAGVAFPDNAWWTWSGNGNVSFTVQFPTPFLPPQTGSNLQKVELFVRKTAAGGNAVPCSIELRQNGSTIVSFGSIEVTSETGEFFTFLWDASVLNTSDASLLQLTVIQTDGGTGNPGNRRAVEINSAELTVEDGIGVRRLVRHRACDGSCCVSSPRFPNGAGTTESPHQNSDCRFHLTNGKENHGCQIMENVVFLPNPGTPAELIGETLDARDLFIQTCLDWPQNTDTAFDCGNCCWRWENDI